MEVIAYYLPQFYPFEENNQWWGEGFTEWTNVGKAEKLFRQHYQPKVPAHLGYYDLRVPEVRERQVELARESGVTAFCYWHYWFGNGRRLLDMPMKELMKTGKPDFPFCLGWANESWKAKVWNLSDENRDTILMEQKYPGVDDIIEHFNEVLPMLSDVRYLKTDDRPIFVVYKPLLLPNPSEYLNIWNDLAKANGFTNGLYFIGHTVNEAEKDEILKIGFDAVNIVRTGEHRYNRKVIKRIPLRLFKWKVLGFPLKLEYSFISKYFIKEMDREETVIPTIIPNWDHTPRSGKKGVVFHNANPEIFKKHVLRALGAIWPKKRRIVFLKSWNEWGEGNYMEPDLKFGKEYINSLGSAISEFEKKQNGHNDFD